MRNYQDVTLIDARLRASFPVLIKQPLGEWLRVNDEEKALAHAHTRAHTHNIHTHPPTPSSRPLPHIQTLLCSTP